MGCPSRLQAIKKLSRFLSNNIQRNFCFPHQAVASHLMIPKTNFRIQNKTFNRNLSLRINRTKNSPNISADASEIHQKKRHLPKQKTSHQFCQDITISMLLQKTKKNDSRGANLDPCLARLAQRWPSSSSQQMSLFGH